MLGALDNSQSFSRTHTELDGCKEGGQPSKAWGLLRKPIDFSVIYRKREVDGNP